MSAGPRGDGGLWDDEEVEVVPPPRPPRRAHAGQGVGQEPVAAKGDAGQFC